MKENDVIAVIIIVLFIVLALIAFGIYRLVHIARNQGSVTATSTTTSSDEELAD
jgi:thiol:disulfide interchange protein